MEKESDDSVSTVVETIEVELPEGLAQTVREQRKQGNVSVSLSIKSER